MTTSAHRSCRCVAVTGATGFIGSHLVERLLGDAASSSCQVVACVRPNSRLELGHLRSASEHPRLTIRSMDLQDPSDVRAAFEGCDTVLHLAAQIDVAHSLRSPQLFWNTNTLGTKNVLDAARAAGVERVVVTSSSEVYGGTARDPLSESSALIAKSPYAASKIAAEKLVESYYHSYRTGGVVVRLFNTFGPRQSVRAVIPWIISQALAGDHVRLGNTHAARDFVFVEDTVAGIIAAAKTVGVEGGVFNLATGHAHAIHEVVTHVERIAGKSLRVTATAERVRGTEEVWTLIGDARLAGERLQWKPRTSFLDGLQRVYAFMAAQKAVSP